MYKTKTYGTYNQQCNVDINAELNFSPLQSICDCALYYVGAVYESLEDPDLYDETGRFRATEKVKQGFVFACLPAEVNCFSHRLLIGHLQ